MREYVQYYIWLQMALGIYDSKADDLLLSFGSAQKVFEAGEAAWKATGLLEEKDLFLLSKTPLGDAQKIVEKCDRLEIDILTPEDDAYPDRLRGIYQKPMALFIKGTLPDIDDEVLVTVVGTRSVTEYGRQVAYSLSKRLAMSGAVIVSGLAYGVDTCAHRGALDGGGRTIAVMGCGVDYNYPAGNRKLKEEILQNGCIISEFLPGTAPIPSHFPVRNRILSGLSLGTLVVEAPMKSGALITARHALEQGRDVFAVPGNISSKGSQGPNRLLKDGAKPVTRSSDILEEYEQIYPHRIKINQPAVRSYTQPDRAVEPELRRVAQPEGEAYQTKADAGVTLPPDLSGDAAAVYEALAKKPMHVDTLIETLNLLPRAVLSTLTELELLGLVESRPGKVYALKQK